MKWTKQRLNNLFFVVGVLACVVMLLTFDVSFVELWQHLCHAGYWLIPIVGVWLFIYGINAWSWYTIIRSKCDADGEYVGFWRVYRLTITGYALNYATPVGGLGGEPYRVMELSKDVSTQHATSSVILYAMMHFFAHFWFWFTSIFIYLALAAVGDLPINTPIATVLGVIILFCLLAFYVFSKGYRNGLVVNVLSWTGHIPGLKGWSSRFREKHAESLQNIDEQIAALHAEDKRAFYKSLLLEYLSRIVQVFHGERESLGDGKGLYHQTARFSTSIVLRHIIEPESCYSFELYRKSRDGKDESSARIVLSDTEAFGLCRAMENSFGVISFGIPMLVEHDTTAYRREAREARNANAA